MATWPSATSTGQKPPDDDHHPPHTNHREMLNGLLKAPSSRPHTPASFKHPRVAQKGQTAEPESNAEDDAQIAKFKGLYEEAEKRLATLFNDIGEITVAARPKFNEAHVQEDDNASNAPKPAQPGSKKRKLDDDYDDYDDDEDDDEDQAGDSSPLKSKSHKVHIVADTTSSPIPRPGHPSRPPSETTKPGHAKTPATQKENAEDARKKLEATKRAETEAVRNMSRSMFFTLESDRDAMLDQQRLDDAERRAEAEAEGANKNPATQQGSLSSANLGASSLTLKNLIARIDQKRAVVNASEADLRSLMSEVRKNRSKWASEDNVGQEELYEAAEKVLNELKAMTEHSAPFLNPVKKKDAPDYFNTIKTPMDLGTMTRKLKQLTYKSKAEFVADLELIWTNCLKYNTAPEHPFRKHALCMQKETDKLVPLIPDITIKSRAEAEQEERRQRIANGDLDDGQEESDDEPIMASRGRKAPAKSGAKKAGGSGRKALPANETTPAPDSRQVSQVLSSVPNMMRAESELDGSQDHSTPPPGTLTPTFGPNGAASVIGAASDLDSDVPPLSAQATILEYEDEEYKLWKQKTKLERAKFAAARHKLFRGDHKLNEEEEALLRTRSGMRRWQKANGEASGEASSRAGAEGQDGQTQANAQTLAEDMEAGEETMLPDYYDTVAAIPDLNPRVKWETDADGNVIEQVEEFMRVFPKSDFIAPESKLTKRMNENMRQMQETRKICSKIGVVKQMQLQTQMYQNQFQKFQPVPFSDAPIEDHVTSETGPLMSTWACKATLQRSVGKIFFHAGFEEFQPSALDTITDLAAEFFQRLCTSFAQFRTEPRALVETPQTNPALVPIATPDPLYRPLYNPEEAVLVTLEESGLSLNDIDLYAREELDRMSTRLTMMHERMKAHLADLLRPALTDETAQGEGSFTEGGEQFVGGDFAEDLDEDFFGFRELGLDKEFGMASLSVPLHLLQNRLRTVNPNANAGVDAGTLLFKPPPMWPKVNVENVEDVVGIARDWFRKRLQENGDRPLVEDTELPPKQRPGYGRARVPASGKIGGDATKLGASPVKKPPPSKQSKSSGTPSKNKTGNEKRNGNDENGDVVVVNGNGSPEKKGGINGSVNGKTQTPVKAKSNVPESMDNDDVDLTLGEIEVNGAAKVNGVNGALDSDAVMMSPESL